MGNNSTTALAAALNGLLADYFALYLKTKNFHWHVSGPHFREYHLLFDEHATELIGTTDLIAERVRKLGQRTLTSIGDITAKQSMKDNDEDGLSADAMLKELLSDNKALIDTLKSVKELASEAGDNATDGMLDDWTDQAEQRAWFLTQTVG
ncbi:MAG: DNA starvation/stationary phase protection protein [Sphingomonadales bacterium]|nr:DNA starvation/stationary phase protection protein [Sphingomonadales bacterium]